MEQLITFLILVTIGYFSGKTIESRHYRSIEERERGFLKIPAVTLKHVDDERRIARIRFVSGNVVLSVDYFKRFLAYLRNIFGGTVSSYETLVDRARREAILRMKETCMDADLILNLRVETSSISKGAKNTVGSIEVFAYGTAVTFSREPAPPETPPPLPKSIQKKLREKAVDSQKTKNQKTGKKNADPVRQSKPAARQVVPAGKTARYDIVFSGEIRKGEDLESVKKRMTVLFKISPSACEQLFAGKPRVLKRNVDVDIAKKFKSAIERAGGKCRVIRKKG